MSRPSLPCSGDRAKAAESRPDAAAGRAGARRAGVLVHPTALGGPCGLGDLGPATLRFLDRARDSGLGAWQLLPLSPTGPGHSPYAGLSSFAGNPSLISPQTLERSGWLPRGCVADAPAFEHGRVDFARAAPWRSRLLDEAWRHFRRKASPAARRALEAFIEHPDQSEWLEDWALFAALRERERERPWFDWDGELRRREPGAMRAARGELGQRVAFHRFIQFVFFRQWSAVRRAARRRGIELMGDLPYYVAHDSADVWARQELFRLDGSGRALTVGGVPPDYFSKTGQRWGNPTYDWSRLEQTDYDWWISRLRANLRQVDRLRLDHFRGFAAYWEIDASERTAVRGRWVAGPGRDLFDAVRERLGALPLIAEDLGVITPDVDALREALGLPGMQVLQFAFPEPSNRHLPEQHPPRSVVYTGTHDNDTTRGWFEKLDLGQRQRVLSYLRTTPDDVVWRMVEAAYRSAAELAVVPLQDFLGLGSEARMNRPGTRRGNWAWRITPRAFTRKLAARLSDLARETGRR
jgi:4-alpha-glucanotransferase